MPKSETKCLHLPRFADLEGKMAWKGYRFGYTAESPLETERQAQLNRNNAVYLAQHGISTKDFPEKFCCAITNEVMSFPVRLRYTYSTDADSAPRHVSPEDHLVDLFSLNKWYSHSTLKKQTNPFNKAFLPPEDLIPDFELADEIWQITQRAVEKQQTYTHTSLLKKFFWFFTGQFGKQLNKHNINLSNAGSTVRLYWICTGQYSQKEKEYFDVLKQEPLEDANLSRLIVDKKNHAQPSSEDGFDLPTLKDIHPDYGWNLSDLLSSLRHGISGILPTAYKATQSVREEKRREENMSIKRNLVETREARASLFWHDSSHSSMLRTEAAWQHNSSMADVRIR